MARKKQKREVAVRDPFARALSNPLFRQRIVKTRKSYKRISRNIVKKESADGN